ncbi:MAG: DNA/RNA non-specific endonuclease [Bacteroidota bacterium]
MVKRANRNRTIYTLLLVACVVGFWVFDNFYTPATYSKNSSEELATAILDFYIPSSTTGAVVTHQHYMLSYNEPFEQAEWVAYLLKKEHLTYDDRKRPYFIEDPKVRTKSADWRNYKGSGYDRGHLCPAGDRRFSEQAYNETFYTSNISPQDREFNAGVWNRLELQVRLWAKRYGELYVVAGGVLEEGLPEIGGEDVDVPRYFYKIVARGKPDRPRVIAFLMPGRESKRPLSDFVVTVDVLEKRTEIDFFEKLQDDVENEMEKQVAIRDWTFN